MDVGNSEATVTCYLVAKSAYRNRPIALKPAKLTASPSPVLRFLASHFRLEDYVPVRRQSARIFLFVCSLIPTFALAAGAQQANRSAAANTNTNTNTIDPKTYGGMKWRLIGPFRGGRVLAVAGVPSQPNTYYFGAVAGGVWKTTDGGVSWDPLFDKQSTSSIGSIAVADSDPNVIYAGTGEACIRGNISFGDGVYKSTDGGKTWNSIGLKDTRHIGKVIVHPANPDVAFVAALGHAYGPNTERSTSPLIPTIRTCSLQRCGKAIAPLGR